MTLAAHTLPVRWQGTDDGEFPYVASVEGQQWRLRVNDFPAEALYTLLINGEEIADYDDWPAAWQRPD